MAVIAITPAIVSERHVDVDLRVCFREKKKYNGLKNTTFLETEGVPNYVSYLGFILVLV